MDGLRRRAPESGGARTRIAFLLSSIAPLALAAVPAAAQSMDQSTHGSTPAPAPSHSPAQVAKPVPEAPAEQMDHDSMPGMDMEPKAPSCSPEHRSEEHTSELQSLMRISYAVFCLKKKKKTKRKL